MKSYIQRLIKVANKIENKLAQNTNNPIFNRKKMLIDQVENVINIITGKHGDVVQQDSNIANCINNLRSELNEFSKIQDSANNLNLANSEDDNLIAKIVQEIGKLNSDLKTDHAINMPELNQLHTSVYNYLKLVSNTKGHKSNEKAKNSGNLTYGNYINYLVDIGNRFPKNLNSDQNKKVINYLNNNKDNMSYDLLNKFEEFKSKYNLQ